jgi:hypothetical protein
MGVTFVRGILALPLTFGSQTWTLDDLVPASFGPGLLSADFFLTASRLRRRSSRQR